jgi:hypothetical protein
MHSGWYIDSSYAHYIEVQNGTPGVAYCNRPVEPHRPWDVAQDVGRVPMCETCRYEIQYQRFESTLKTLGVHDDFVVACRAYGKTSLEGKPTLRAVFGKKNTLRLIEMRRMFYERLRQMGMTYRQIGDLFQRNWSAVARSVKAGGNEYVP